MKGWKWKGAPENNRDEVPWRSKLIKDFMHICDPTSRKHYTFSEMEMEFYRGLGCFLVINVRFLLTALDLHNYLTMNIDSPPHYDHFEILWPTRVPSPNIKQIGTGIITILGNLRGVITYY